MFAATQYGGDPVEVPPTSAAYAGPLPAPTVRSLRRALAKGLVDAGMTQVIAGQVLGMPTSTISDVMKPEPVVDDELPPDEPPGIGPPEPYRRPKVVEISADFIRGLVEEYRGAKGARSRRVKDSRSLRIGQMADVQEWLDGLQPGQLKPRT